MGKYVHSRPEKENDMVVAVAADGDDTGSGEELMDEVLSGPEEEDERPISHPRADVLSGGESSSEEEDSALAESSKGRLRFGFVAHSRVQGAAVRKKSEHWEKLRRAVVSSAFAHRWRGLIETGGSHPGEMREGEEESGLKLSYTRVWAFTPDIHRVDEDAKASQEVLRSLSLRELYRNAVQQQQDGGPSSILFVRGVARVVSKEHSGRWVVRLAEKAPSFPDFVGHVGFLKSRICGDGIAATLGHTRLRILETLYKCHRLLNGAAEVDETRADGRDFFGVRKVDRVDVNRCCAPSTLVSYIRRRVEETPDEIVLTGESPCTLAQVFDGLDVALDELNVDSLDVMSSAGDGFSRLGRDSGPTGSLTWAGGGRMTPGSERTSQSAAQLRRVFLGRNNAVQGKYFADIVHLSFRSIGPYQYVEYRIPFNPTQPREMENIASWVVDNQLRHPRVRWILAINRAADVSGVETFEQILSNIFVPLLQTTLDPLSSPKVAEFLERVVALDLVGDEEWHGSHLGCSRGAPPPGLWSCKSHGSPSLVYWMYFMWANLSVVNALRKSKLIPHAGELGSMSHPSAAFLLTDGISQGLRLADSTGIQYLYYLTKLPVIMAPLAHNCQSVPLMLHPLKRFLQIGLRVALSTDAPLKYNLTTDALVEEFSVAAACFRFSPADLAELSRNSVEDCGLMDAEKGRILGRYWKQGGAQGNDPSRSDVPNIRAQFRFETLRAELLYLESMASHSCHPGVDMKFLGGDHAVSSGLHFALASGVPSFSPDEIRAGVALMAARRLRKLHRSLTPEAEAAMKAFEPAWLHDGTCPFECDVLPKSDFVAELGPKGVVRVWRSQEDADTCRAPAFPAPPSVKRYLEDIVTLMKWAKDPEVKLLCHRRLTLLSWLFVCYREMNHEIESSILRKGPRDIFSVPVCDTHVHAASAATAPHLRDFILRTLSERPDVPVQKREEGDPVTLSEFCASVGIHVGSGLSVDHLGVTADHGVFRRFDRFNSKFSVAGSGELRAAFLKTNNLDGGKLFAQLLKEVVDRGEQEGRQLAEYRLSVYGADREEWDMLGKWAVRNDIHHPNVRWLVQIPRLYWLQKKRGKIHSFGDMLRNVFQPLFDAVIDPPSHPALFRFMQVVVGLDSVDDESVVDERLKHGEPPTPDEWTYPENPPYHYQMYYMAANLRMLNALMVERGMRPWTLRPHAGEAGSQKHLGSAFLLADAVNHGIMLENSPVLQYLFYIEQIGLAVSPMSNNRLFLGIVNNPFHGFFQRGLSVSLSTDDPLQFHSATNPLHEEYGVAANVWHLGAASVCEIARSSVLQSNFETKVKKKMLGESPLETFEMANVPAMRLVFRKNNLDREKAYLDMLAAISPALVEEGTSEGKRTNSGTLVVPSSRRRAPPSLRRSVHSMSAGHLSELDGEK